MSIIGSNVVVINSNDVAGADKSRYVYKFIQGGLRINEGSTISVREVILPYSWFNIQQAFYNNTSFTYTWVDGTVHTVQLLDGFYSATDLNQALENDFLTNGYYLIDSSGNNVYYIQMAVDPNLYAVQMLFFIVPTSLPTGYTAPSNLNAGFYSNPTAITPQLTILSTNNFGDIIGYSPQTLPTVPSTVDVSFLSDQIPNATPVNSIVMRCNLVSNNVSFPTDILDSFTFQNVQFGANGTFEPKFQSNVLLKPGVYNSIELVFVDQNFNAIPIQDSNVCITLLLTLNRKA